jgi:hypothetical protein
MSKVIFECQAAIVMVETAQHAARNPHRLESWRKIQLNPQLFIDTVAFSLNFDFYKSIHLPQPPCEIYSTSQSSSEFISEWGLGLLRDAPSGILVPILAPPWRCLQVLL